MLRLTDAPKMVYRSTLSLSDIMIRHQHNEEWEDVGHAIFAERQRRIHAGEELAFDGIAYSDTHKFYYTSFNDDDITPQIHYVEKLNRRGYLARRNHYDRVREENNRSNGPKGNGQKDNNGSSRFDGHRGETETSTSFRESGERTDKTKGDKRSGKDSNNDNSRRRDVSDGGLKEQFSDIFIAYDKHKNAVDIQLAKRSDYFKNKNGKRKNVLEELYRKNNFLTIKQEAIVLIDELIANADYGYPQKSRYPHGWLDDYGKSDWDYWTVYIQEQNKTVWEATLNIANTTNGEKILYDIDPIKMVEGAIKSATTTTNNNIPQNTPGSQAQNSDRQNFQMETSVEETPELIAVHNMTPNELVKSLSLGNFTMPSIAVMKAKQGFKKFGEISAIFRKDTIDLNRNKENKLYGGDAWTPQQVQLKKNAKFDANKIVAQVSEIKNLIGKECVSKLFNYNSKAFRDKIVSADGSVFQAFAHDIGMQTAFAMKQGVISEVPTKNGVVDTKTLNKQLEAYFDTDAGWRSYRQWLNGISDNVITSYDNATSEDILRNMKQQKESAKPFKLSMDGTLIAPTVAYESVDTLRKNKGRLSNNAETSSAEVAQEFLGFARKLGKAKGISAQSVVDVINASFEQRYSTTDIMNAFKVEGISIGRNTALSLQELYKKAVELPTEYFEAKPHREVGFEELAMLIVPDNTNADLKAKLTEKGLPFTEYKAGNEQSRLDALNSVPDVQFSERGNFDVTAEDLYDYAPKEFAGAITPLYATMITKEDFEVARHDIFRQRLGKGKRGYAFSANHIFLFEMVGNNKFTVTNINDIEKVRDMYDEWKRKQDAKTSTGSTRLDGIFKEVGDWYSFTVGQRGTSGRDANVSKRQQRGDRTRNNKQNSRDHEVVLAYREPYQNSDRTLTHSEANQLAKEKVNSYKEAIEKKAKIESVTQKALVLNRWMMT